MKNGKIDAIESKLGSIADNRYLSEQTKELCKVQDFLIIPGSQDEGGSVFAQESITFYKFIKLNYPNVKIAICANDEHVQIRSLHSFDIYMPIIFIAKNILLPFAVGLVTSYVYDKLKGREHENCNVQVKFIVQNNDTKKELTYNGPAKDLEKAFEKIDISKL